MPHRFAGTAHPHGEGKERQSGGRSRKTVQHGLIGAYAGVMVDVSGFGHPHDRMNEHVCFDLLGGAQRQLDVGPMHGVAGLEGDDSPPSEPSEILAQLCRPQAQGAEVVVDGQLYPLEPASHIDRTRPLEEVRNARVLRAGAAEDQFRFPFPVRVPDFLHVENGEHHPFRVPESKRRTRREGGGKLLGNIECDGHRPQGAVRQAHLGDHPLVVATGEETGQRREASVDEKLQVA